VPESLDYQQEPILARVLISAGAGLAVPALCALLFPDDLGEYRPLLWLLALIPVMRMGFYRGWRGAVLAGVAGMAALVLIEVVLAPGNPAVRDPRIVPTVLALHTALAAGTAGLAKRFGDMMEQYRRGELLRRLEKARACPRRCGPISSSRSSRPRARGRARDWGSRRPTAS
jgi:hypothetical protein